MQLSWDGGTTWTSVEHKQTLSTTSEITYTFGGGSDKWGRTWSKTNLSNTNFKVRVINGDSDDGSSPRSFSLDWVGAKVYFTPDTTAPTAPGTPITFSPTNNAAPTWRWTASTDNIALDHYVLYWDTVAGGETNSSGNLSSGTTSFTHGSSLSNGTWYAKVKAFDTAGNSSASGNGSVAVDTTAPTGSPCVEIDGPDLCFNSIQDAINAVSNGNVITLSAGLYPISSMITINKSVTLRGPQAGIDPRPGAGASRTAGDPFSEAILDSGGTLATILRVAADDVVINGLEVKSGTGDLIDSSASNPVKQRPAVRNNIIHDSSGDEGIQLRNTSSAVIEHNYVYATAGDAINLCCGSTNGIIRLNEVHDISSPDAAIYAYGSQNTTIEENLVYDVVNNDGIKLGDKSGADAGSSPGGAILNNIIHDTKQDGISVYQSGVSVERNEVYHSTSENGAIHVAFAVSSTTISGNYVHDNALVTSKFSDAAGILIRSTVNVASTSISENKLEGNTPFGLTNHAAAVLTAAHNWWGSATGPTHTSNPDGSGDAVSDNVTFIAWCTDSECATTDTTAPTVTLTTDELITNISPIPVTATFSESVTGFTDSDAVTNGTVDNFLGSGTTYTFDVTPAGEGTVTVDVAGGAAQDTAGNANTAAAQLAITFDSAPPVITSVAFSPAFGVKKIGDIITLTINADAPGYTAGAITVNGVAAGGFTDAGGGVYTATYTAASGNTDVADNSQIPVSVILTDAAGNSNIAFTASPSAENSPAIDANAPTVSVVSPLAGTTYTPNVTLQVTTDENAECTYNLDSATNQTMGATGGSSHSQALSSLATGTHTVQFTCTDPAGNGATGAGIPWTVAAATGSTLESGGSDVVFDSATDGQADLPNEITNIALSNDSALDVNGGVNTASGGNITIGGSTQTLNTYTNGDLAGVDLSVAQTIGGQEVFVEKGVKLESGTDGIPIVLTNTAISNASVSIPDGTTILAPNGWNGTIQPPKSGSSSGTAPSGFSVGNTVIEVGSTNAVLIFDKPATLILNGVSGAVGYKPAGASAWIRITNTCSGGFDAPSSPAFPEECAISNGIDTKIVTYHFTTFGSLVRPTHHGDGGGGGVSSATPEISVPPAAEKKKKKIDELKKRLIVLLQQKVEALKQELARQLALQNQLYAVKVGQKSEEQIPLPPVLNGRWKLLPFKMISG